MEDRSILLSGKEGKEGFLSPFVLEGGDFPHGARGSGAHVQVVVDHSYGGPAALVGRLVDEEEFVEFLRDGHVLLGGWHLGRFVLECISGRDAMLFGKMGCICLGFGYRLVGRRVFSIRFCGHGYEEETYVVLVRGPFDLVACSCAEFGGEVIEFDSEVCERGGDEEGGQEECCCGEELHGGEVLVWMCNDCLW